MPSSDGFSIKTTIAQVGQVARSQVKAQQSSPAANPQTAEQVQKDQRPDRVRKAEESEKSRTDPDRRREGRRQQPDERDREDEGREDGDERPVGTRIDTKA